MKGYNLNLTKSVSKEISIPLIASGGAGKILDFVSTRNAGASAMSAGSIFVFTGKLKGILINYPDIRSAIESAFQSNNLELEYV